MRGKCQCRQCILEFAHIWKKIRLNHVCNREQNLFRIRPWLIRFLQFHSYAKAFEDGCFPNISFSIEPHVVISVTFYLNISYASYFVSNRILSCDEPDYYYFQLLHYPSGCGSRWLLLASFRPYWIVGT